MFAILLVFFVAAVELEAAKLNCEKIETYEKFKTCCYLNDTTEIREENVEFDGMENLNVSTILFNGNKKIEFLPVKVHKKFLNLKAYLALGAAIKKISASNFAGLSNLKYLVLRDNKIKFIPDDCFQGLNHLQDINLIGNHIKKMNRVAFAHLPQLVKVDLGLNDCISNSFSIGSDSNEMRRKISRRCGSENDTRKKISCSDFPINCKTYKERDDMANFVLRCCDLDSGSYIDAPDFTFSMNSNYTAFERLIIENQRDVIFLPVLIHEQFPNLKFYQVKNAPIQMISKRNFEKLNMLERLSLERNQIQMIKKNTFEDLANLNYIQITNQPLIALNGQVFANLHKLGQLNIWGNRCIDSSISQYEPWSDSFEKITKACGFDEFDSIEIDCEDFLYSRGTEQCVMKNKTKINATNFVIAELKDEGVKGIDFEGNKNIEYLPSKIFMQFPNLAHYSAANCSIKQISRQNFEKLIRLRDISLWGNQIQKISGNTFNGLENLRYVELQKNQIKSISGRTFDQLPQIVLIDLEENECIDEYGYWDETNAHIREKNYTEKESSRLTFMKNFTRLIIQQCAFTETGEREFEKVFDIECGVEKGSGFIVGGNETERGEWPPIVALLGPEDKFFCGGVVITATHVLTAAHCVHQKHKEQPRKASDIAILLGRHNIRSQAEVGSEVRGVEKIKIHPQWNWDDLKYEGDIAVLEMDRAVQFSPLIQPICLTVEREILQEEADWVVGWGQSEFSVLHEAVPRKVLISSTTTEVCFAKDFMLGSMYSPGMFCAGGQGFGPCHGDSGGGFFVKYHGLWTLRGIVSSGVSNTDGRCNVDRYTLFTNVLDFTSWINDVVKEANEIKPSNVTN